MDDEEQEDLTIEDSEEESVPLVIHRKKVDRPSKSTTIKMLREIGQNIKNSGSLISIVSFIIMFFKGKK